MEREGTDDTICAISTPLGEGGLGVIRISGPDAFAIADRVFRAPDRRRLSEAPTHTVRYGHILDAEQIVDEVLATVLQAPRTYTREDTVELSGHGGLFSLRRILGLLVRAGARLAQPGEFTKRAFLNGRLDLAQAEAVMDLIRAQTDAGLRLAQTQLAGNLSRRIHPIRDHLLRLLAHLEASIDFVEEGLGVLPPAEIAVSIEAALQAMDRLLAAGERGRFCCDGIRVAIVGRPNVGKSSLLNALLEEERAIVTPIPGTTRDVLEGRISLDGIPFHLFDTAGLHDADHPVEQEGIRRTHRVIAQSDLHLVILDGSEPLQETDRAVLRQLETEPSASRILVLNKCDLAARIESDRLPGRSPRVSVSAKTGEGLERLKTEMRSAAVQGRVITQDEIHLNLRHQETLLRARRGVLSAAGAVREGRPIECLAVDLRAAVEALGEITGAVTTEDLLDRIFKEFCIGK
jgi:tRNA modification GTPase